MLTERYLWLGATTTAVGILLLLMLHAPPERRDRATGLPDIPVHSIVVDPDDRQRLYLSTDLGVVVSIDGGRTWMSEETGGGAGHVILR